MGPGCWCKTLVLRFDITWWEMPPIPGSVPNFQTLGPLSASIYYQNGTWAQTGEKKDALKSSRERGADTPITLLNVCIMYISFS